MNRCMKFGAGLLLAAAALTATAQTVVREIPKDIKRGTLVVTQPPQVTLDGQPDRLSPGARIRNTRNLLLMSGSVVGQTLPVVYRRDPSGLVHEVWVLTPEENARLGGDDSPEGYRRFTELLQMIFGR